MQRLLNVFNKEYGGLHEAAYLLGAFAIFSQVLALVRDRLLAGTFGAGAELDIYYTAFRIPDFIYVTVASLVSSAVVIPFFIKRFGGGNHNEIIAARAFINSLFTAFIIFILFISIIVWIFMPFFAEIIAPGFDTDMTSKLIFLSRILLLSPILLGVSNLFGTITQSFRRFFVYAISPVVYNVGIIIGILAFGQEFGISGVVFGVIIGATFHVAIQAPTVFNEGFLPIFSKIKIYEIKEVIMSSIPRTIALSAAHLVLIFFIALASSMGEGSIAVFNFAFNLQSVPLSIIGVSYSVAAFPTLARLFVNGDRGEFISNVIEAARHIIFWSLPVLVLFIVLRAQIVRTILGTGYFDWSDTRLVAAGLALFSVSVVAQGVVLLFVRGYYAAGNTRTPLFVNIFSSAIMIISVFILLSFFREFPLFKFFIEDILRVSYLNGTEVLMLPLAFSVGSIINALILWVLFRRDFNLSVLHLRKTFFHSFAGSMFMGFVAYRFLEIFDNIFNINTFFGIFFQGLLSGILGIIAGLIFLHLLKNQEISDIWESLHHRFWRVETVAPEQNEL